MLRAGWRRRPPSPWRLTTLALLVVLLLAAGPGIVALRQTAGAPLATGQVRTDRPNGLSARSDDLGPPRNSTGAGLQDDEAPEGLEVNTVSGSGHRVSVPVLMYHYIRINPHPGDRVGFNLSVTPQHFAQQMQLLHDAGAHAVTLADVDRALNGESQLPPHPVVLTFDDGYDDFATEAAPIMKALGLRGTTFVVSGFVGRSGYMTADQIHQVQSMRMVVGAHTVHHLALAHLSLDAAKAEIEDSRAQLEQLTGSSVDDFAYPYGDFSPAVAMLVRQAGFDDAVTTIAGSTHGSGDLFWLARERIGGLDTLDSFAEKAGVRMVPLHPVASLAALESGRAAGLGTSGSPVPTGTPTATQTPTPSAIPTPDQSPSPTPVVATATYGGGPRPA